MAVEVHLVTPEREVWSGQATQVIARGVDGELGVLAGHAPLLIQLAIGPLRIQQENGEWLVAVVDGGFFHVSTEDGSTRADVLATHAELEDEIDIEAARRAVLGSEGADDDDVDAQVRLARAQARVNLAG